MDANLNFLTAPVSNPASVGPSSGSVATEPALNKPMNGQEFAEVMRDLMTRGERQELAGSAPIDSGATASAALQTLNLGGQFSVITSATPLPDTQSLAEFARAQGLSETAVQALFGDLNSQTAGLGTGAPTPDLIGNGQAAPHLMTDFSLHPFSGANLNAGSVNAEVNPTNSSTLTLFPSVQALGTVQANENAFKSSHGVLSNPLWPSHLPSPLDISDQTMPNAWSQAPQAFNQTPKASDVASLLQTASASGVLQTFGNVAPSSTLPLDPVNQQVELSSEMGPLDAMRMRMVPAWESMTRQLAKLNGTAQSAAWGQLSANIMNSKLNGSEAQEVILDLGIDDPNLIPTLDRLLDTNNNVTTPFDSARNTASSGALGSVATSAALASPGMTDRAAQIQDLADKLGKAMGERLQDQMERGEWKLQLKLNPAHLGKIDVELDMSAGALDAVFKTDNLLTRELIAQGMPKLKDSLSQSGMTVANVWVNSENHQNSGGNSTPRQNNASDNSERTSMAEVSTTESRIRDLRSNDAWDTLA